MSNNKLGYKYYFLIFVVSIVVHLTLMYKVGIGYASDFSLSYEPTAIKLVQWFSGDGAFPISGYKIFHSVYIIIVSLFYYIFGVDNMLALVIFQIVLTSFVLLLILRFLDRTFKSQKVILLTVLFSIIFFDNIYWNTYCSTESIYKSCFLISYLFILDFYFNRRYVCLFTLSFFSFFFLLLIRMDTLVLFIPVHILLIKSILFDIEIRFKPLFLTVGGIAACSFILYLNYKIGLFNACKEIYLHFFKEGLVLTDVDTPIKGSMFDIERAGSLIYLLKRFAELFCLRIYYLLNIFAHPFWSKSHSIYYAINMFFVYIFSVAGIIRLIKERSTLVFFILMVPLSSILLHGLYSTESSLRQNYTPLQFLIIFAGYGLDFVLSTYSGKTNEKEVVNSTLEA